MMIESEMIESEMIKAVERFWILQDGYRDSYRDSDRNSYQGLTHF